MTGKNFITYKVDICIEGIGEATNTRTEKEGFRSWSVKENLSAKDFKILKSKDKL